MAEMLIELKLRREFIISSILKFTMTLENVVLSRYGRFGMISMAFILCDSFGRFMPEDDDA